MSTTFANSKGAISALRGISRRRIPDEHCELCSQPLGPQHPHLLQRTEGRIVCACDPCAILFNHRDGERKMVRVPRDIRSLAGFQITDGEWNALRLPIDLAFFVPNSSAGRVIAYYPSPAGTTESLLSLEAWDEIVRRNPVLSKMEADVEALLVNRTRERRDYYIAPIDECYKLTGLIRIYWRGFSGGEAVWNEIDRYFSAVNSRAIHA